MRFSAMQIRNFSFFRNNSALQTLLLLAPDRAMDIARLTRLCSAAESFHLPEADQGTKIRRSGRMACLRSTLNLNIEYGQHYLKRGSITPCFLSRKVCIWLLAQNG